MNRRRTYVVLPARGISGEVMQSDVFAGRLPASVMAMDLQKSLKGLATSGAGEHLGLVASVDALSDDLSMDVLSQYFDDGPAVVRLTPAGRMALEAVHPDVRIVPLTHYSVADAHVASSAMLADGSVHPNDCRHHYLSATSSSTSGEGVIVGIIDTGVESSHPDLAGKVIDSRSLVPDEVLTDGGPVDWQGDPRAGHGTHVAGIVAGTGLSGAPTGLAPAARIISYRVFPHRPRGQGASNAAIIDAIRAGIDNGCHILNLSIAGRTLREDGVRSAINDAWSNGVLCIAAAGNDFRRPVSYPAAHANCVAVTAIGRDGSFPDVPAHRQFVSADRAANDGAVFLAAFSNVGPQVRFAAPGHAIVAAGLGRIWEFRSGTSMASPFVAGLAARLLSENTNVRDALGDASRSGAMVQMLFGRSRKLGFASLSFEGFGLPLP